MFLHLSQSNIPNVHCRLQLFVARLVSPRPNKGVVVTWYMIDMYIVEPP